METLAAMKPLTTVVIGAGNVASHLVPALALAGCIKVTAVWSRTRCHAEELAARVGAPIATDDLGELPADAEFYLVSTADEMTRRVADEMTPNLALWAHTSGSVEAEAFSRVSPHYGVFYPLQTFSRNVAVDLAEAPFFIEGSDKAALERLMAMARAISDRVYEADSTLRMKMHVAAVFACNFANHLWTVADRVLHREARLDLSVLKPLLQETLRKALAVGPADAQTGPAARGDHGVMAKHVALLPDDESKLYEILSNSIENECNKL